MLVSEVAMIRRKKDSVLTQLPKKYRSKVVIEISTKCKKMMKKIASDMNDMKDQMEDLINNSKTSNEEIHEVSNSFFFFSKQNLNFPIK